LIIQASLDTERALRHTILKQCKLDDIQIPMKKGRLEEIDDDGKKNQSINNLQYI
jgi:hypothetical protein